METTIIEEYITFPNGNFGLTGILSYPKQGWPEKACLFCSPHPHFAGDMNNNIIKALSEHFAEQAITLRFDYRGVERSQIDLPDGVSVFDYWDRVENERDYEDAISDVSAAGEHLIKTSQCDSPIAIGYSFGAITAGHWALQKNSLSAFIGISPPWTKVDFSFLSRLKLPILLVYAKKDFLYDEATVTQLQEELSEQVEFLAIDEGDHFFRGEEPHIVKLVEHWLKQIEK